MLYLGFPFYLIQRKQVVLQKGKTFKVSAPLAAPQESYRGIYLPIDLPEQVEVSFPVRRGQAVFVKLRQDEHKVGVASVSRQRPSTDAYLRATVRYEEDGLVFLDYPASAKKVYLTPSEAAQWEEQYYSGLETQKQEKQNGVKPEAPNFTPLKLPVAMYVYRGRGIADHILLPPGAER